MPRLPRHLPAAAVSSSTSAAAPTGKPKIPNIRSSRARTLTPCVPIRAATKVTTVTATTAVGPPGGLILPIRAGGRRRRHRHRSRWRAGCSNLGTAKMAGNNRRRGASRIISGVGATTDPNQNRFVRRFSMTTRHAIVLLGLLGFVPAATAQGFRIEDAGAARLADVAQLKPGVIAFSDQWG